MKRLTTEQSEQKLIYRIIIKFHDAISLGKKDDSFSPVQKPDQWVDVDTVIPDVRLNQLFTSVFPNRITELTLQAKARDERYHPPNFLNYYTIHVTEKIEAQQILEQLRTHNAVDQAYIETSPVFPPAVNSSGNPLSIYQNYLNPGPEGIDAAFAWQFKGGDGSSTVKFIDIEQGWIEEHEDVQIHTLSDSGLNHPAFQDHGTAVLGIIKMKDNNVGGIGITPGAYGFILSQWRPDGSFNIADALMASIHHLSPGDVLLIQSQAYDSKTQKSVPLEIFETNFQLIRLATALGIIVVEPAGNGNTIFGQDLDLITNADGIDFLNRTGNNFRDSGAIIVAAASSTVPHNKIGFSNYGSRVDCYAWGENVMTAGYFSKSSDCASNSYTNGFSGTSSASAIITGVVIAIQSIAEANLRHRLEPTSMRALLSDALNGTESANGNLIDKIGVMPDLKRVISDLLKLAPSQTQHKWQQYGKIAMEVKEI